MMKILTNFKDLYDGINASVRDDTEPVYRRIQKESSFTLKDKREEQDTKALEPVFKLQAKLPADLPILLFCGKAYPYLPLFNLTNTTIFYDLHEYVWALKKKLENDPYGWKLKEKLHSIQKQDHFSFHRSPQLNFYFWSQKLPTIDLTIPDSVFRHFKAPVIAVYNPSQTLLTSDKIGNRDRKYYLHTNPPLATFEFAKKLDAFSIYQELSMFIGNNLAEQMDPHTTLSDKERAETHGFNEWSFRRHKTEDRKFKKKQKS